jgi:hypothetical protein
VIPPLLVSGNKHVIPGGFGGGDEFAVDKFTPSHLSGTGNAVTVKSLEKRLRDVLVK